MLTARFRDALGLAAELHAGQVRKGTHVPYISHLMAVCAVVIENGGDEDEAVAALLHDAVEDQGGAPTLERIRERYGDRVAEIVAGCTDTDVTPKPPWRARKEHYLAHLPRASRSVLLVSTADKLHNARTILADFRACGEEVWCRFKGGREGSLWYYRALVETYRAIETTPLVEELDRVVTELERLAGAPVPTTSS